jgi:hypothetical protein
MCTGDGLNWSTLTQPASNQDSMTMLLIMIMFTINALFYSLVVWYVSSVFPGGDAVAEHPLFFVQVCKV